MGRPKKKSAASSGKKIEILPGMVDVLPGHDRAWDFLVSKLQRTARGFGFAHIELPVVESMGLYDTWDIGDKTLINFMDPEGRRIAIRPDTLPSLMRAYGERKIIEGERLLKVFYSSPTLTYDERLHKFCPAWEYGFELFGEFLPLTEVQLISLLWKFLKAVGLNDLTLEINNIGTADLRSDYEETLRTFLNGRKYELTDEVVNAIEDDALNIFRVKDPEAQAVAGEAPQLINYLDDHSHKTFTNILEGLDELGIVYNLNPMFVGKKGYSGTVFSIKYKDQNSEYLLGDGGHHEEILKEVSGKVTSCFGFTGYMEVLQKAVQVLENAPHHEIKAEVFLVPLGELASKKALKLFSELWDEKITVHDDFGESGVKNQLKMAESAKATIALIIGQKEAMDEMVILRDVRSGMQEIFQYERIIDEVKKRLGR